MSSQIQASAVLIRNAILADVPAMAATFLDARKTQYTEEIYLKLAADPEFLGKFSSMVAHQNENFKCWVAVTEEGEFLGFSTTQPMLPTPDTLLSNKFGYVSTYIKRSEKAKGLGTVLFNHNMDYCRQHSSIEYVVGLQYRENPASVKITDNAGFGVMGVFDELTDYPSMSFIFWHAKHT